MHFLALVSSSLLNTAPLPQLVRCPRRQEGLLEALSQQQSMRRRCCRKKRNFEQPIGHGFYSVAL